MRTKLLLALILAINPFRAYAFTDGSGYQILVQMLKQVGLSQEQLSTLGEQLNDVREYKEQFEDYTEAFEELKRLDEQRAQATEMIRNGDLDAAITLTNRSLTRILDLSGIDYPTDGGDIDIEKILSDRIDKLNREYALTDDPFQAQRIKVEVQALEVQRTLESLRTVAQKSLTRMAKDESVDESTRITAENTALLARLAVEEQQAHNNKQSREQMEKVERADDVFQVGETLKKLGEARRWGVD
ncbi:hypothetical protein [Ferrimonas balearica]|uniref:hypothetical protein n=1 Tax=Ferrimonas balearica TaxID=44012 RepID=UPI001C57B36E|nr:hypothetical protein [Ferrimonas balearica]MBW3163957.1 hypothetical protein [Ferrimonas balearica]